MRATCHELVGAFGFSSASLVVPLRPHLPVGSAACTRRFAAAWFSAFTRGTDERGELAAVDAVIDRGQSTSAGNRYPDCTAFAAALADALGAVLLAVADVSAA